MLQLKSVDRQIIKLVSVLSIKSCIGRLGLVISGKHIEIISY